MHRVEGGQILGIWHPPSFLSPNLSSGSLCLATSKSTSANQLSQCALSIPSWSLPNGEGSCGAWTCSSDIPQGFLQLPHRGRVAASSTRSCCHRHTGFPQPDTHSTSSVMESPTGEPQTRLELFCRPPRACRKEEGSCVHQAQSQSGQRRPRLQQKCLCEQSGWSRNLKPHLQTRKYRL